MKKTAILLLLLLLIACNEPGGESTAPLSSPVNEDMLPSNEDIPLPAESYPEFVGDVGKIQIRQPIALGASGQIEVPGNEPAYVFVEMTSGVYGEVEPNTSLRNWSGDFRIAVYTKSNRMEGTLRSVYPIDAVGFDHDFPIFVDDYNNDGYPDFTVALERLNSVYMGYHIYTVGDDYAITELEVEGNLALRTWTGSLRLIREGEYFLSYFMANSVESSPYIHESWYLWNGNMFVLDDYYEILTDATPDEEMDFLDERIRFMEGCAGQ